jgi:hypothetical protein
MKTKATKAPRKSADREAEKPRPEFWLWAIAGLFGLFAAFQVYGPALHGPFLFGATDKIAEITGGESHRIAKGDVFVIPAGVPHWFKEVPKSVNYFVVKVLK